MRDPAMAIGDVPDPMLEVAEVLGGHALPDGVSHADDVDTEEDVERSYVADSVSGHGDTIPSVRRAG
ncbi:hypothetical protein CLM85_05505 [Streptomyces albidoflavus]|nr:hypothetical protein CLM85_05505 [Streptomyces albidoflavus]